MIYKTVKEVEDNVKVGEYYKWNNNVEGFLIVKITEIGKSSSGSSSGKYIRGEIVHSFRDDLTTETWFGVYTNEVEKYNNVFKEINSEEYPEYYI